MKLYVSVFRLLEGRQSSHDDFELATYGIELDEVGPRYDEMSKRKTDTHLRVFYCGVANFCRHKRRLITVTKYGCGTLSIAILTAKLSEIDRQ
jgi:hypothetical protein